MASGSEYEASRASSRAGRGVACTPPAPPGTSTRLGSGQGRGKEPARTGQPADHRAGDRSSVRRDIIARGYDDRRIARELFLSDKTVRNHVSHVLGKPAVDTRGEAVIRARNAGLGG